MRPRPLLAALAAVTTLVFAACSSNTSAPATSPSATHAIVPTPSPVASVVATAKPATPAPSVAPSAPAVPTKFTSTTYGYSLTVPAGWTVIQATAAWGGTGGPSHDAPQADQFVGPAGASVWALVAPTTKDLAGYVKESMAAVMKYHGDTCPAPPEAVDPIKIGGEPGTLLAWNCGILINIAPTVHKGTAYLFGFRDPAVHAATDPADRAAFLALLESVRFPD